MNKNDLNITSHRKLQDKARGESNAAMTWGLESIFFVARFHHINLSIEVIRYLGNIDPKAITSSEILKIANILAIKAKLFRFTWSRLDKVPFPAILQKKDGTYFVAMKKSEKYISIHDPENPKKATILQEVEFEEICTKKIILLKPEKSHINTNEKFGLAWFKKPILKHKKVLGEVLVAAFFVQIFALAMPMMNQIIFDKVVVHNNLSTLQVLGIGMIVVIIFEAVFSSMQSYLLSHTAARIDVLLGTKILDHLIKLPILYFEKRKVGDITAHIREAEGIKQFLMGSSVGVLIDIFFMGIFLLLMLYYSVELTMVVIMTLPFFIGITLIAKPGMRRAQEEKMVATAASQTFLVEILTGIHTVKSLSIESSMKERWGNILARQAYAALNSSRLNTIFNSIAQIVQKGSTLALLWSGTKLVIAGSLTIGELIAFQMLSGRVIQPVVRLVRVWQDLQSVLLSVERLGDIMNNNIEPENSQASHNLSPLVGTVKFESVIFRYGYDQPEVIRDLSFHVAAGETIGIVGRSGSGKSTLAKLLQRLYVPEGGSITIDGLDLRLVDHQWLRSQIGVVLQENFLFNGTIAENIAIQNPQITFDRIIAAARLAGADEFISSLPNKYDTQVGERGTSLSGGQRQRIAIARALITDPRILIFDEATSALDSESERIIQENLSKICEGRTVFIIAHRFSTIRNADQIIVLNKGSVCEKGTHEELLELDQIYATLFLQQTGGVHA